MLCLVWWSFGVRSSRRRRNAQGRAARTFLFGHACTPTRKGGPSMLVLSRRPNQKILFPAINTAIQIVSVQGSLVRLGIEAPPEITVLREELLEQVPK